MWGMSILNTIIVTIFILLWLVFGLFAIASKIMSKYKNKEPYFKYARYISDCNGKYFCPSSIMYDFATNKFGYDEVNEVMENVIKELEKSLGAELRK